MSHRAIHEHGEAVPFTHHLSVALILRQVDSQSDEHGRAVQVLNLQEHVQDHWDGVGVREHALAFIIHGDVIQQRHGFVLEIRVWKELDDFRDETVADHIVAQLGVEAQIQQEAQHAQEQNVVRYWHKLGELVDNVALRHLVLVLLVDGQLLEKGGRQNQQIDIFPLEHFAQVDGDVALLHLALDSHILCQVQEHVEANVQEPLLFALSLVELLSLLLAQFLPSLLHLLQLHLAICRPLQFKIDDAHSHVPHLMFGNHMMTLRKVGDCKKDGEDVDGEVHRFATILAEHARERAKERFVP
mmetsp:Transcript_13962/g.45882  ORF Transcript_13962/g.45882 Transcript_13962/m.45882 type:complete len:300 (-) Transcript_13962:564-1463(-)